MKNQPLVSIITPAYNSANWIETCIQSVQAQSYQNWEHLVAVDKGTTDNTAEIIKTYSDKDPRVRLLVITDQKGLAITRNRAISEAKGQYIAFLDSDDMWMPEKLSMQVQFMQEQDLAISCTGFRRISQDLRTTGVYQKPPAKITYWQLLANNQMACLTVMLDKNKTGPIQFKETYHEDFLLWLSILKKGYICGGLDADLARYRIVKTSRSANKFKMLKVRWKILREFEQHNLLVSLFYLSIYVLTSLVKYSKF